MALTDVMDSLLLDARRFRAFLANRLHGWTFMIALGFVAAALALLVDGDIVAGIGVTFVALPAVWLSGVWVSPRGVDRYALRVSDVLQDGSRAANSASRACHGALRKLRTLIEEVDPPLDCTSIHREITDRMHEMDRLEADHSDLLADRAIRMNVIRSDLSSALERLSACPSDSQANELVRLVDRLVRELADARRATEAPLKEMSERLRKITVPRGWRDKHDRCESAVSAYLAALNSFNDARESEDADAIRGTAQKLSVEQVAMEACIKEYVDDLRANYQGRVSRHFEITEADSC
jgi:hypothetical protein